MCPHCLTIDNNSLGKLSLLQIDLNSFKGKTFYTNTGCEYCNYTGYKGRIAIFELLIIDEDIKAYIEKGVSIQELQNLIKSKNVKTLIEDGIEKALNKITSLDEIIRQC